jgi:hypothetical protein
MNLKKISTYIGYFLAAGALITMVQGGIVKVGTLIYHEEIEEFNSLIKFQTIAKDSIIPEFSNDLEHLKSWRKEKSRTKAIGLRKSVETGELWYRAGLDLKLYRAYYSKKKKGYFYDRKGVAYPCH